MQLSRLAITGPRLRVRPIPARGTWARTVMARRTTIGAVRRIRPMCVVCKLNKGGELPTAFDLFDLFKSRRKAGEF